MNEQSPLLEAHDLTLAYGPNVAVAASGCTIPGRGVTAIIGPNGSGKSTLLHGLAGLIAPATGTLRVMGRNPQEHGRLSYVLQSVNVPRGIPITVREAVGMGRYPRLGWFRWMGKEDRRIVEEAMERLDITHLAKRHLSELSGGQRQRVHVAQGIAQEHDVLLLDEPLTGLDITSARTIDRIIHGETAEGRAVIMTTHDLEEAQAADHVVLMAGRILAAGQPDEVLTAENLATAYGLGSLHAPAAVVLDDPTCTPDGSRHP